MEVFEWLGEEAYGETWGVRLLASGVLDGYRCVLWGCILSSANIYILSLII